MRRTKPAFTLLELLTVIAIMTLLIGIIVPSLSAARRSAKANTCLSHLKGIGIAFSVYINENEEKFPPFQLVSPVPGVDVPYIDAFKRRAPQWHWFLSLGAEPPVNPTPFRAQIDRGGYFDDDSVPRMRGAGDAVTLTNDLFTCPALDDEVFARHLRDGAYGYNYQYLGNARDDARSGRWDNFPVPVHRIRQPASAVVVADSRGTGPRHGKYSFALDPPRLATEQNARRFGPSLDVISTEDEGDDGDDPTAEAVYEFSPAEARHGNKANVVFGDTHAAAMTLVELGYQIEDGSIHPGVPKGTALPVPRPTQGTYTANNRLFSGEGTDSIAAQHQPEAP